MPRSVIHSRPPHTLTSLPDSATAAVRTQPSLVTAATMAAAITETAAMAATATRAAAVTEVATATRVMAMVPVNRRKTRSTRTSRQATVGNGCRMNRLIRITENP